jgi:hypothetical protein
MFTLRHKTITTTTTTVNVIAGGVQKEFFQLLIAELFDPKFGMLTYEEEARVLWFNKVCFLVTFPEFVLSFLCKFCGAFEFECTDVAWMRT